VDGVQFSVEEIVNASTSKTPIHMNSIESAGELTVDVVRAEFGFGLNTCLICT